MEQYTLVGYDDRTEHAYDGDNEGGGKLTLDYDKGRSQHLAMKRKVKG